MYQELAELNRKPGIFSRYTTETLWTDPHIASQMLTFHLDRDIDAASRKASTIDATIAWMDRRLGFLGKRVLDLGCGPGLYATRMAALGASVTGLDFSELSIAYAREHSPPTLAPHYVVGNYLHPHLPGPADIVTLIYGDYCALSPDRRRTLLDNVTAVLAPGGRFVFDLFSPGQFNALRETLEFGHNYMGGFWSAGDYFAFKKTALYPEQLVSLERYLVVEAERSFEIYNWMQYFTPASIAAELAAAGFRVEACVEIDTGAPWQSAATPFFAIAGAAS